MLLIYMKYFNFFASGFSKIFHTDSVALDIILPIGISFYTFTGIAYLTDIYHKKYVAEKSFINFALYISFFPKLVAGPIVCGNDFLPQANSYKGINISNAAVGIQIFVFGLFKKIVLADHVGVFVDDVFYAPAAYNTWTIIFAVISYSLQIYFDFSGYSDMAVGIAKMLGFDLKRNFNLPYMAQNISDFWKRWHISLSSWLQEYLYIPLGGNRKGEVRTYINLIMVMLFSGLWHGAGMTFLIWGLLHGVLSCIHRFTKRYINIKHSEKAVVKAMYIALNFITVTLLWVVFRAENINKAFAVWKGMFIWQDGIIQPYSWSFFAIICLVVAEIVAVRRAVKNKNSVVEGYYPLMDLTKTSSLIIFFTFSGLTVLMGYFGNNYFIYGKF